LHAHTLRFRWPGENQVQEYVAPLPEVLDEFLQKLKKDDEV
jgi:hypothetical protein